MVAVWGRNETPPDKEVAAAVEERESEKVVPEPVMENYKLVWEVLLCWQVQDFGFMHLAARSL